MVAVVTRQDIKPNKHKNTHFTLHTWGHSSFCSRVSVFVSLCVFINCVVLSHTFYQYEQDVRYHSFTYAHNIWTFFLFSQSYLYDVRNVVYCVVCQCVKQYMAFCTAHIHSQSVCWMHTKSKMGKNIIIKWYIHENVCIPNKLRCSSGFDRFAHIWRVKKTYSIHWEVETYRTLRAHRMKLRELKLRIKQFPAADAQMAHTLPQTDLFGYAVDTTLSDGIFERVYRRHKKKINNEISTKPHTLIIVERILEQRQQFTKRAILIANLTNTLFCEYMRLDKSPANTQTTNI